MSTNAVPRKDATTDASVATVNAKIEAVVIPVSNVDRAKEFYRTLGWRLDADFRFDNGFRVVQFYSARVCVLDSIRHEYHVGRAGLGPWPVSGRL